MSFMVFFGQMVFEQTVGETGSFSIFLPDMSSNYMLASFHLGSLAGDEGQGPTCLGFLTT